MRFALSLDRSPALSRLMRDNRLGGCQSGNGYAVGRTTNVVQTDRVAELHRRRFTTVFTANAQLQLWACGPAFVGGDAHQTADAFLIEHLEGVHFDDASGQV